MILQDELQNIVIEQLLYRNTKEIIQRNTSIEDTSDRIIVISGIRRCGKSTLLQQGFIHLPNCLSLNFEDPRLENFELSDFSKLENIANSMGKETFIFDEIQNIEGWEKFARTMHDKGKKLYITGSNAGLLSKELGTRLTGRYKQIELFPFDYTEYLNFTNQTASADSLKIYLTNGGFPEYLNEKNPEYLRTLLRDIVVRDIAVRRGVRNEHLLVRLAVFLMSNVSKEFSFNNITNTLNIKSVRTTIDYCDYLKDAYLVEFVPRFSFSIKQQQANPKKVYSIDTGMAKANSLSQQEDWGRILENAVYLQLRKISADIQYYKDDKSECDFLLRVDAAYSHAVQVCWQLTTDNLQRELTGLRNALKTSGARKGIIVTFNQEDVFDDIQVVPMWKIKQW